MRDLCIMLVILQPAAEPTFYEPVSGHLCLSCKSFYRLFSNSVLCIIMLLKYNFSFFI
jgi:hypothetical protein